MRVQFVETMRGHMQVAGEQRPLQFTVKASAASAGSLARTGCLDLTGTVQAPPWCAQAPARGQLRFDLLHRQLHYELHFDGLRLTGHKQVRAWRLLRSMTELPVQLLAADGQLLASGMVRFAFADLPDFLASMLPLARAQARALDVARRSLERLRLDGKVAP